MATTLEMLLAALSNGGLPPVPGPAKPMPLGVATPPLAGPMLTGPPDAAPVAPLPALDTNLINQLSGPAPVVPTLREPGTLEKLATALLGVNAGFQGRGGQFVEQVREERQRPIREYQAQLERFNNRRTQAVELATRKQERQQEQAQRRADANVDFEREQFLQRSKFKSEEARNLARQAFDLEKIREQERILDERQAARERADAEKQRRAIENELATKGGAPPNIAKEISEYQVGLRPTLSAAAEKWRTLQARKAEAQLARVAGGGSASGGGQVMAQLANGQVVPASLVNKDTGAVMLGGQSVPVTQYVGGRIPSRPAGPQPLPGEAGGPEGPLVPSQVMQAARPAATPQRAQAKAKLVKNGYSSKEADAELDRLGIQ